MNLDKVNSFAKFYETGNTAPNRTAEAKFKRSSGLDDAEKSMINKAFPEAKNSALNLYLSDGHSRTEQPDSKGNHIDFRI